MSLSSVGSSEAGLSALRARVQSFRSGQSTITKDELKTVDNALGGKGPATDLLANYDKIDLNGDGIGFEELMSYAKSATSSGKAKDELTGLQKKLEDEKTDASASIGSVIENFTSADADGDGKVSRGEYRNYLETVKAKSNSMAATAANTSSEKTASTDSSDSSASEGVAALSHFVQNVLRRYGAGAAVLTGGASALLSAV